MKIIKSDKTNSVVLNSCIKELIDKKYIIVSFGSKSVFVSCMISNYLDKEEIIIPSKIYYELMLVDDVNYNVATLNNTLRIGPLLGLLLYRNYHSLNNMILNKLLRYTQNYNLINGIISTFTLDKMNFEEKIIDGYIFNPKKNCWQNSVFPFPDSMFRLTKLSKKQYDMLISIIGNKFYNNYFFDKWELYEFFKNSIYKNLLPKTYLINDVKNVLNFLSEYNDIFIKPINGSQGVNIFSVSLKDNNYILRKNKEIKVFNINEEDKFLDYISGYFKHKQFLVQQAIDLIEFDNKKIDFRVIMQKDIKGNWICLGIIARLGQKESIVSNVSQGGTALKFKELCSLIDIDCKKVYSEIESLSISICNYLDKIGLNCGNLGLDIGIDKNLNYWLIEINNIYPDPTIALDANDQELFNRIKSNTLMYAKYLSGF